jgi:hypothetical protein
VRGQRRIKSEQADHLAAVRCARLVDDERLWAIEDCRHFSMRPEQGADRS